jgi:hypothetical protein
MNCPQPKNTKDVVRPEHCALAVAVPTTQEELEKDIHSSIHEFARQQVVGGFIFDGVVKQAWANHYGSILEELASVVDQVGQLGVTVVKQAKLSDLAELLKRFRAVTVLAHSLFRTLGASDILDREMILNDMRSANSRNPTDPRHVLISKLQADPQLRNADSIQEFIKALNYRLEQTKEYYYNRGANGVATDLESAGPRVGWTPVLFYDAFPDAVKPPLVIEMRDGFHNFEELVAAVPSTFTGTIDFLTCSALAFCEPLRRRRPNCGDILCPKQPARIPERLALYQNAVRLLAKENTGYSDAMLAIHAMAVRWVQQSVATTRPKQKLQPA